ncbi:hypothetical protein AHF37_09093 [Paragonimus kellicotti]|nr:hypothetical protein AHF37_09093 [Paragonimus kellicotti]
MVEFLKKISKTCSHLVIVKRKTLRLLLTTHQSHIVRQEHGF